MSKGTVFVVDDDEDIRAYLGDIINDAGYNSEGFSSGSKVLDKLQTTTPAIVFLDIQMPQMNGFQVLKEIRNIDHLSDVPVIFLSSISSVTGQDYDPDTIQSQYGVRPDAFISKMIKPDEVLEYLDQFLKD